MYVRPLCQILVLSSNQKYPAAIWVLPTWKYPFLLLQGNESTLAVLEGYPCVFKNKLKSRQHIPNQTWEHPSAKSLLGFWSIVRLLNVFNDFAGVLKHAAPMKHPHDCSLQDHASHLSGAEARAKLLAHARAGLQLRHWAIVFSNMAPYLKITSQKMGVGQDCKFDGSRGEILDVTTTYICFGSPVILVGVPTVVVVPFVAPAWYAGLVGSGTPLRFSGETSATNLEITWPEFGWHLGSQDSLRFLDPVKKGPCNPIQSKRVSATRRKKHVKALSCLTVKCQNDCTAMRGVQYSFYARQCEYGTI